MTHLFSPLIQANGGLDVVALLAGGGIILAIVFGLAITVLVVRRYRTTADGALRALVVGICLVAVVPLLFQFIDLTMIPDTLRYLGATVAQGVGLLAIVWGLYGPVDSKIGPAPRPSASDLVVGTAGLVLAMVLFVGGLRVTPTSPVVLGVYAAVAGSGLFVGVQAFRAYWRRGNPRMLTLGLGLLFLVAAPGPVTFLLVGRLGEHSSLLALWYVGLLVVGQVCLLATLLHRGRTGRE
jgi:hypothetical protein